MESAAGPDKLREIQREIQLGQQRVRFLRREEKALAERIRLLKTIQRQLVDSCRDTIRVHDEIQAELREMTRSVKR